MENGKWNGFTLLTILLFSLSAKPTLSIFHFTFHILHLPVGIAICLPNNFTRFTMPSQVRIYLLRPKVAGTRILVNYNESLYGILS